MTQIAETMDDMCLLKRVAIVRKSDLRALALRKNGIRAWAAWPGLATPSAFMAAPKQVGHMHKPILVRLPDEKFWLP